MGANTNVPAYSQYLDVQNEDWNYRSCGIVALKMLMDFYREPNENPSFQALIKEGVSLDGYIPGIGWKHFSLAELAVRHGFWAKNFDWAKETDEIAFQNLEENLKSGPIMASIHKNLNPGLQGHLVVVTSFDGENIFYNDSIAEKRDDIQRKTTKEEFLKGWKKRIVVLHLPEAENAS